MDSIVTDILVQWKVIIEWLWAWVVFIEAIRIIIVIAIAIIILQLYWCIKITRLVATSILELHVFLQDRMALLIHIWNICLSYLKELLFFLL